MITKTMAYKVGNETFPTFEEAQIHSLTLLFSEMHTDDACGLSAEQVSAFTQAHADDIIEILMCQPDEEKPARKPRKDKGTKRAAKVQNATVPVTNTTTADAAITQIVES